MATHKRRDGSPVWIDGSMQAARRLERIDLGGADAGSRYDEAWLQALIHRHPHLLPIGEIEPAFGPLVSVCRELPLVFGAANPGNVDNVLMTADGGLVLVETKLWRNPESRRKVVAQAMDYAAATFRLDYAGFEAALRSARRASGEDDLPLYDLVARPAGRDEAEFIDTVSRNLRLGRAIVAVVGDGIREDIRALADLLQSHAGNRLTFALIELAIYGTPLGETRIVVPSILAETAMIERGVVRIVEEPGKAPRIVVNEPPKNDVPKTRAFGISEDEFFEYLERSAPGTTLPLKAFLEKADLIGVYADIKNGLTLRHRSQPGNKPLSITTIRKDGWVDTDFSTYWGRTAIGLVYNETLAGLIGGFVQHSKDGQSSWLRTRNGKTPRVSDLLPQHERAWLDAIERYVKSASEEAERAGILE